MATFVRLPLISTLFCKEASFSSSLLAKLLFAAVELGKKLLHILSILFSCLAYGSRMAYAALFSLSRSLTQGADSPSGDRARCVDTRMRRRSIPPWSIPRNVATLALLLQCPESVAGIGKVSPSLLPLRSSVTRYLLIRHSITLATSVSLQYK